MTLRAVFFDVGETLVDEERYWHAGLIAFHLRRGPWGRLQQTPTIAIESLAELPSRLGSPVTA